MSKLIRLESCKQCEHYYFCPASPPRLGVPRTFACMLANNYKWRQITEEEMASGIPDWCPLPDIEEK